MATRELIDIILRLRKEGTGIRDTADELKGIDKAAKKAKGGVDALEKSWKKGVAVAGSVAAAFYTLKKAYDFGKEGAAIAQTADSFDRLMASMGAGPGVLQGLRDASLGTVDDMTLMSSTMTLLAGTSQTLGMAMVDAAPRLMEIAKAANKLNPALGDTAFMYQSIATGVKRAQPLILDNLGLTIKVGDANAAYAKQLGKTVEQLTAEEKQVALLNATLEAGDRMIQQVGGSTEAAGDTYAQLETTVKNVTDGLKAEFEPVVRIVVDVLNEWADTAFKADDRVRKLGDGLRESGASYDYYVLQVLDAAVAEKQLTERSAEALKQHLLFGAGLDETDPKLGRFAGATEKVMIKLGLMTEAEWDAIRAGRELDTTHEDIKLGLIELEEVSYQAGSAHENLRDEVDRAVLAFDKGKIAAETLAEQERNAAAAADEFKASLDLLHFAMRDEFSDALAEMMNEMEGGRRVFENGTITLEAYNEGLRKSTEYFREQTNAIIYNIAEKQILDALEKGLIEDVNKSGTAYDEATEALWAMGHQMGLLDEATLALMQATQEQTSAFIAGKATADDLAGGLGALAGNMAGAAAEGGDLKAIIDSLQSKTITITTNFTATGHPAGGDFGTGPGFQHGGQFLVRGPAGPDRVPVNFMATRGEVVTVTPVGGMAPPNPAVTNNFNLNVSAAQSSQGIIRDFNIMQSMV